MGKEQVKTYLVTWEIEVDADSPRDAAQRALDMQRDPDSTATVFGVVEFDTDGDTTTIDLSADEDSDDMIAEVDDDGCPKNDPDYLSNADECHDACEANFGKH